MWLVDKESPINDRNTGRRLSFGFVDMLNPHTMRALSGADFKGRALKLNEAQVCKRSGTRNRDCVCTQCITRHIVYERL